MLRRLILAALLCTNGCTVMGTDAVPDAPPSRLPTCDGTSGAGVFFDLLLGAPSALITFNGISNGSGSEAVLGGLLTTVFGSSIYFGAKRGSDCDAAKERHTRWLASHQDDDLPIITRGARGGHCYPNGTCDRGLSCNDMAKVCVVTPRAKAVVAADDPLPMAPARGRLDGSCYDNLTCDAALHCDLETHHCAPGAIGTLAAPCYANQSCEAPLTCRQGMCEPP